MFGHCTHSPCQREEEDPADNMVRAQKYDVIQLGAIHKRSAEVLGKSPEINRGVTGADGIPPK